MDAYSIIAAWLAFKVASKWQVWAVIVSVPKTLEGVNEFDFLVARHKWASQRLVTFLLGTNANILIAFTGVGIGKFANHLCSLLG